MTDTNKEHASPTLSWDEFVNTSWLAPLQSIIDDFSLRDRKSFPRGAALNAMATGITHWQGPKFVDQQALDEDTRYYEEIIAQSRWIPTREDSWHDFFNAAVWLAYPQTKQLLNDLHFADIQQFGTHPRTPRRNRITHFDECGLVLAVDEQHLSKVNPILAKLASHQWHSALWEDRAQWHKLIFPEVFGHANLEMLLNPYWGLTAKWLAVPVPSDYGSLSSVAKKQLLDERLYQRILQLGAFELGRELCPLPILGIPGWGGGLNETTYNNREVFRPRNPKRPETRQLPVKISSTGQNPG